MPSRPGRPPPLGPLLKDRCQPAIAEDLITDKTNIPDLGDVTLIDIDPDGDPIALERGNRALDRDIVLALSKVLLPQLALDLGQLGTVEHLTLSHAGAF